MKILLSFAVVSALSLSVFAAEKKSELKCVNAAVKATVMHNHKTFKVGTSSCGIKLLHAGEHKETYIVCTSDETDPMEYITVMAKNKNCKAEYIDSTNEASTPSFDDDNGLLKSIECSIDFGDKKLACN